jgi:hypothetical protein
MLSLPICRLLYTRFILGSAAKRWGWALLLLVASASPIRAATISAFTNDSIIGVGSVASVEIRLQLDPLEFASIFEGRFDLAGLGSTASVAVQPLGFGSTWDTQFGGVTQSQLILSLTSSNRDDHVLLATIDVAGLAPGFFDLLLAPGTLLQRDTNVSPFFEDVALGTAVGTNLISIQVVPEPSTGLLMGLGLLSLGWFGRRLE